MDEQHSEESSNLCQCQGHFQKVPSPLMQSQSQKNLAVKKWKITAIVLIILIPLIMGVNYLNCHSTGLIKAKLQDQISSDQPTPQQLDHLRFKHNLSTSLKSSMVPKPIPTLTGQDNQQNIIHHQPHQNEYYNRSNEKTYNLWLMDKDYKIKLFQNMKKKNLTGYNYTPFISGKDQEVNEFFKVYERKSKVVNWDSLQLTNQEINYHEQLFENQFNQRSQVTNELISRYQRSFANKLDQYDPNKGITNAQFLQSLELRLATGKRETGPQIQKILKQQREMFERKYQISKFEEIHTCIMVPSYNNEPNFRYIWSLESLLQQEYSNYRVIIVDDASTDKTASLVAKYLKWRHADKNKFILVQKQEHSSALENIYYAAHKYCDYNQIFMIVDGDDELLGRQSLKVFNAVYQKQKLYLLYSQFISYNPTAQNKLEVGISTDFPIFVKKTNSYRVYKHIYSQLRSMMSDLILLESMKSLQKNGKFFEILYDNALFYPALEMSCARNMYIPEVFYYYNINTGNNDWLKARTQFYKDNRFGIELQKPYRCIEDELFDLENLLPS